MLIIVNVGLFVGALASAGGLYYARHLVEQVNVVEVEGATRSGAENVGLDEARNFLIIGTDSAERLDVRDPVRNDREDLNLLSDVVMILRVDPKSERAHLLSIPRDTTMEIYPTGQIRRINTAIQGEGGAKNLIETLKRNLGISIDHYVQVDLYAFKTIVATLGGVSVYLNTPIYDDNTKIDLSTRGCIRLDQDQALAYARARHLKFVNEDGEWEYEQTGDPGRVERQQQFVKLIMREAISGGIRNPSKALALGNSIAQVVTMDEQLRIRSLIDLGSEFRTFSADDLVTQIVPTEDYTGPAGASYQRILWDEAKPVVDVYRGMIPGEPITPRDVIVSVIGTSDLAPSSEARKLAKLGFDASGSSDEDAERQDTVIRYGPDGGEAAVLVARYLNTTVDFRYDDDIHGTQLHVVLGQNYRGIYEAPVDPATLPADELEQLEEATGVAIGPDGVASTTTDASTSTTEPEETTTTEPDETTTTDGDTFTSSTSVDGFDSTSTSMTDIVIEGPSTTASPEPNSKILGGFLPIDYEKSLNC